MRWRRRLAWKCHDIAHYLYVQAVLWISWEQGVDARSGRL